MLQHSSAFRVPKAKNAFLSHVFPALFASRTSTNHLSVPMPARRAPPIPTTLCAVRRSCLHASRVQTEPFVQMAPALSDMRRLVSVPIPAL